MYGRNAYGKKIYGGLDAVTAIAILNDHDVFVIGSAPVSDNQSGFVNGPIVGVAEQFTRFAYISGLNTAQNNTDSTWGEVEDQANGIVNIYKGQDAYIPIPITPLSSSKLSFISSRFIMLRSPTLDGIVDSSAATIDDTSILDNNGRTINLPAWVDGPHG